MDPLPSYSPFQQNVNNFFIKLDKASDHLPIVSYTSNSVNIFQKMIVIPLLARYSPATVTSSHYLTHIKEKKASDCILLMIPEAAAFIYIGKRAFSKANKKLDEEFVHVTTKDKESGVKNQESKKQEELLAVTPRQLKSYEIERNARIEKNLLTFLQW